MYPAGGGVPLSEVNRLARAPKAKEDGSRRPLYLFVKNHLDGKVPL